MSKGAGGRMPSIPGPWIYSQGLMSGTLLDTFDRSSTSPCLCFPHVNMETLSSSHASFSSRGRDKMAVTERALLMDCGAK